MHSVLNQSTDTDVAQTKCAPPIPHYLQTVYDWAYVRPSAIQLFEREWLINLILFGHYARLRDAALDALGTTITGRTLQIACVYGNLTAKLATRLSNHALLDVVDVLPLQLQNLRRKMPTETRMTLLHADATALPCATAQYHQVLLFFLLHEMPAAVRYATLSEAVRVLKPGGKLVIVDYHQPVRWHPLRPIMRWVFRTLEPFAMDLWHQTVSDYMPLQSVQLSLTQQTYFGGLYQRLVYTRR